MGLIGNQTIKNSVISYFGIGFGLINTIFLATKVLKPDENGLIILLTSSISIFSQFASLGLGSAIVRFLPKMELNSNERLGFLNIVLLGAFLGCFTFILIGYQFNNELFNGEIKNNALFSHYLYFFVPLGFAFVFMSVLESMIRVVLHNAVIGPLLRDLLVRVGIFLGMVLFYLKILNFKTYMLYWLIIMILPAVTLLLYAIKNKIFIGQASYTFLKRQKIIEISKYCIMTILTGSSSVLVQRIDILMISQMVGLGATGIYGISTYFATVIKTPSTAIYGISGTIISEKFSKQDYASIFSIYKKSCVNQLFIGLLIFLGIWANIHNFFKIIPHIYQEGKYVVFFMGIGTLIDMGTGINGVILTQSKYYSYDTFSTVLLIAFTVGFNFAFIPLFGITGGAIAFALSIGLFNFSRFLLVWLKLGMQPIDFKSIQLIIIAVLSYFLIELIPIQENIIIDITLRSVVILLIYLPIVYLTKITLEFNQLVNKIVVLFIDLIKKIV